MNNPIKQLVKHLEYLHNKQNIVVSVDLFVYVTLQILQNQSQSDLLHSLKQGGLEMGAFDSVYTVAQQIHA